MVFDLHTTLSSDKKVRYDILLDNIGELLKDEENIIANLANAASLMKSSFETFLWAGFYLYSDIDDELVLGPFQGKIACTRIKPGKGVCGSAFELGETIVVGDVNKFPGHIFCDSTSKSEIVIPLIKNNVKYGVLDIDSDKYDNFDDTDKVYLEKIANIISEKF